MINFIKRHPYKSTVILCWAMISIGAGMHHGWVSGLIFAGISLFTVAMIMGAVEIG